MSKEEIRHCPSCGGAAKVKQSDEEVWVECKKCGLKSHLYPNYITESRMYAIEDWNSMEVER